MASDETSLLRRTEATLDAILRGNHAGWDQALAALRKELREALGLIPAMRQPPTAG